MSEQRGTETHEPADAAETVETEPSFDGSHNMSFGSSFVVSDHIDLVWKDVAVEVNGQYILQQASGVISSGLIAIMGPSGSGKTTLLNCLSYRSDAGCDVTGTLHINGEPYGTSKLKKFLGYVMQDDVQNPLLTVRETLGFVAESRLRHKTTAQERALLVDEALSHLSLAHCADVLVGSGNDGISAGERKRLSVAMELLSKPKILFLDEPTSNLDSLDALHFVRSMRNLVDSTGCVIVCTIHQPQYKVFSTFDRLIMLRSGLIVYDGPIKAVSEYCTTMGSPCPADVNPADHLMEVIAPNPNDSFATEMRKRNKFGLVYLAHRLGVNTNKGLGRQVGYLREAAPFLSRLTMSFHRSWLLLGRRRSEWIGNLVITLINAFLVGSVFYQIGTGPQSVPKRLPALFFTVVNQASFGAISTVALLPMERPVVLRERAAGSISALSYFLAKAGAEMLWKLPFPIIFTLIVYFLIGFQPLASAFFRYLAVIIISYWTGMGVAMFVSAIAKVASVASLVMPLVMETARLFASYFAPQADLPPGIRWISYISYIFYSFNAIAHSEMNDLLIDCSPEPCIKTRAVEQLYQRGQYLDYNQSIGILVVYMGISLALAYFFVRILRH